jgi:hypothetical protein
MGVPWAACGGDGGGLCCKRSAVAAGPGTTHVTEMYLGDSHLTGSLSSSLTGLSQLRVINLACNKLRGPVPANFLDWPSFDSGRNGRCQLENQDSCTFLRVISALTCTLLQSGMMYHTSECTAELSRVTYYPEQVTTSITTSRAPSHRTRRRTAR